MPDGSSVETTATEYGTLLKHYFSTHGEIVIDASRGNPGGFPSAKEGLDAGIAHLSEKMRGDASGYTGGIYPESESCAADLNHLFGTEEYYQKNNLFFSTGEIEALNAISNALEGSRVVTP
jgi:hypothetical protein